MLSNLGQRKINSGRREQLIGLTLALVVFGLVVAATMCRFLWLPWGDSVRRASVLLIRPGLRIAFVFFFIAGKFHGVGRWPLICIVSGFNILFYEGLLLIGWWIVRKIRARIRSGRETGTS